MKSKLVCPKCAGCRIWQIEQLCAIEQKAYSRPLRLASRRKRQASPRTGWQKLMQGSADEYDAGFIEAWVCAQCGYTELWSRGLEELEHNPSQGIHLHDGGA